MQQGTRHDAWMTEPPLGTQRLEPRVSRDNLWMCTWANCAGQTVKNCTHSKMACERCLCTQGPWKLWPHSLWRISAESSCASKHLSTAPVIRNQAIYHQHNLKNKCTMNKTKNFATKSPIPATEIQHSCWQLRVTLHACLTNIYCKLFKPSPCHQTKPTNFVHDEKPVLVINLPLWSVVSFSVQWRTDGAQTAPQTQNRPSQSRTSWFNPYFLVSSSFGSCCKFVKLKICFSVYPIFEKKTRGLWHLSKVVLSPPCFGLTSFLQVVVADFQVYIAIGALVFGRVFAKLENLSISNLSK